MKLTELIRNAALQRVVAALNPMSAGPRTPPDFVQHVNPAANARRKLKRQMGARQFRKLHKAWQRAQMQMRRRVAGD